MSTGKWREPGVPHKGWKCLGVDEVDGEAICEMCEVMQIRYIHHMQHEDYPDILGCGCVCAGNMAQDLVGAKRRESAFKTSKKRKAKLLARDLADAKRREAAFKTSKDRLLAREWRTSAKGNLYINEKGWNIVVYQKGAVWSGRISHHDSGETYFLKSWFPDCEAAKRKALEVLEAVLRHLAAA